MTNTLSFDRSQLNELITLINDPNNQVRIELSYEEEISGGDICSRTGIVKVNSLTDMLNRFLNNEEDESEDFDSFSEWIEHDLTKYIEDGSGGYYDFFNVDSLDETQYFYFEKWGEEKWCDSDGNKIDEPDDFYLTNEYWSLEVYINEQKVASS